MLRLFVLLLILANAAFFTWSAGYFKALGFAPAEQREAHRLAQQIQPEAVRPLSKAELRRVEQLLQEDQAPKECLQAGPFDTSQVAALQPVLGAALPAEAWRFEVATSPERWIVYMGKFSSPEALDKKRNQLAARHINPIPLKNSSLELGLSLSAYPSKAEAEAGLERLVERGIRTAKVVKELDASRSVQLRLPALSASQKARALELQDALFGKPLRSCSAA